MKTRQKIFLSVVGILMVAYGFIGSAFAIKDSSSNNKTAQTITGKTLTIGLEGTYPPYSYRKNGRLTGFEVDLGKAAAAKMGLRAKFVPTKWDSLVAGLGAGKFDLVMNDITQTPERAKQYDFSIPYIRSHYILMLPANSKISNLKQIKGLKMAQSIGTNNADVAKKYGASVVPDQDFVSSLDMIKQGRVSGSINNREAWYAYKRQNPNGTRGIKIIDVSKQEVPTKISALFNKNDKGLRNSFNHAMTELQEDGTIKRLSLKYFGTDISK